jgi:ATP/ADP translocase
MNKYQKIALIIGVIVLLIAFGKTITRIGFGVMALFGKLIIIIVATIFIISALRKATKKK